LAKATRLTFVVLRSHRCNFFEFLAPLLQELCALRRHATNGLVQPVVVALFHLVIYPLAHGTKRLELLRQVVPKATKVAVLVNPNSPETDAERSDVLAAAQAIGQQLVVQDVNSDRDIEIAFATFAERGVNALLVGSGPFLTSRREWLVALAAQNAIPTFYPLREFAAAGGLMSYGTSITEGYRQAGVYTGRILKGEKAGDLPVMQSTKFEFVINLKTAKALGLTIPPMSLATADEVIE
jgi:putative tryptophan/tyrosine transport system substrate-binding protein